MKIVLVYLLLINITHGYKILYLMPLASKSHQFVFGPLISELVKRGHDVTVVSPYAFSDHSIRKNIREIVLKENEDTESQEFYKQMFVSSGSHIFPKHMSLAVPICEIYLTNPDVQALLKRGKQFDVVVVSQVLNDCALATASLLGKNVISHSSTKLYSSMFSSVPRSPSYVPYTFSSYDSKMSFFQRLDNTVSWLLSSLIYDYYLLPRVQAVIAKHLPENPSIMEARKHISFTITNADFVITSPRPSMPNMLNAGGVNCKKANPLIPKEFEDFIQSSGENGFILFSLGSIMPVKYIPPDVKNGIVNAFSRLKQHVIWKCEEEIQNLPPNIKITKWMPQKDLLGHPKLRLFITHGGMLSLQESVYNAVPLLVIPLFADQPSNAARLEKIGIGVTLDAANISEASLYSAITNILTDKSFSENIKKYSNVFCDFIENRVEEAAYWVEYVIRHDGAPFLTNSGEELNYFQYFLLDIASFLVIICSILIWIAFKVCLK